MTQNAAVVPTYDLSCAMDNKHGCPHGNVHNVHKQPVGARLALMLQKMKLGENVTDGPRVTRTRVSKASIGNYAIQMSFDKNDLKLQGTRNCTTCCGGNMSDFDFSIDGLTWYDGSVAQVLWKPAGEKNTVQVSVQMSAAPKFARYTANRVFPQCAVYSQDGLPAYPFQESNLEESEEAMEELIV